jgi:hypothetical protein
MLESILGSAQLIDLTHQWDNELLDAGNIFRRHT